jgi:hypothetical protein
MTVPYGAWMGSRIEDAFYAPHDVAAEVQSFLADHEALFSRTTYNSVAVVYSVETNRPLIAKADSSDNVHNARDESVTVPYRTLTAQLAAAAVPFDVVIFPDAATATDRVGAHQIHGYATVVLPHCTHLTKAQAAELLRYLDEGGCLVVVGDLGITLPESTSRALVEHPHTRRVSALGQATLDSVLPLGRQAVVHGADDVSANIHRLEDGSAAVHLLSYAYDDDLDRATVRYDVTVTVQLPVPDPVVTLFTSDGKVAEVEVESTESGHLVRLPELGLYSVLRFAPRDEAPGTAPTTRSQA